jgi:hypoxanthine phosphoribosyltransferase
MTAQGRPDQSRPGEAPWKGLDTAVMPVFIGYDQVERMVAALLERAIEWRPDGVVGLARGGVVPAAMASGILALPLSFVEHDKVTGGIAWIGPPTSGRRVLLVDDCCSTGTTLHRARAALMEQGRACLTLVVVHDPDTIRHKPDLSFPMRELFRLPWERGEATPTGRAAKASGDTVDPRVEAPFTGVALDETLTRRIADNQPLARVPIERAVLICARPETEYARVAAVLAATPYRHLPLVRGPDAADGDCLARFKARTATRFGCTHFIDRDPGQAIAVAAQAPHLIVTWWSEEAGKCWTIGAAAQPVGMTSEVPTV